MGLPIGLQKRTDDGVIGTSGTNIRVFGFIVRATSGGAAVVSVYKGTSTGGVLVDTIDVAAASTTTRVMYAGGLFLPGGCYIDVDTNTSFVTAIYMQENS